MYGCAPFSFHHLSPPTLILTSFFPLPFPLIHRGLKIVLLILSSSLPPPRSPFLFVPSVPESLPLISSSLIFCKLASYPRPRRGRVVSGKAGFWTSQTDQTLGLGCIALSRRSGPQLVIPFYCKDSSGRVSQTIDNHTDCLLVNTGPTNILRRLVPASVSVLAARVRYPSVVVLPRYLSGLSFSPSGLLFDFFSAAVGAGSVSRVRVAAHQSSPSLSGTFLL